MSEARSIEVKVGALILVSLAMLGGFILVMGGLSFEKTYPVYVDFDNPGGLLAGAAVRVGGVKVGSVKDLQFLGGKIDPKTGRRVARPRADRRSRSGSRTRSTRTRTST